MRRKWEEVEKAGKKDNKKGGIKANSLSGLDVLSEKMY